MVPKNSTSSRWRTWKVIWSPSTVPWRPPFVKQADPDIVMVPDSADPSWTSVTPSDPDA